MLILNEPKRCRNQVEAKSLADLDKAMERQRADMSRVNAMLAETTEAHVELVSETFGLRSAVNNQIKVTFAADRALPAALALQVTSVQILRMV